MKGQDEVQILAEGWSQGWEQGLGNTFSNKHWLDGGTGRERAIEEIVLQIYRCLYSFNYCILETN